MADKLKFDEIGYWSEVKLDIVREYAAAYSTILSRQRGLHHVYIDGFAGAGLHRRKATREFVSGSPLNALHVQPPFREFFLVDLNGDKVEHLRRLVGGRPDVHLLRGDCNKVLLGEVFPHVRWEDFRRGLCLLDPYGLDLHWEVIWRDAARVPGGQADRFTSYWGDESWRSAAYRPRAQRGLFGEEGEKVSNEAVAEAFRRRLREVAGFANVPKPMAMRNAQGAVVYYLFFASQKDVANKIVTHIFRVHEKRRA